VDKLRGDLTGEVVADPLTNGVLNGCRRRSSLQSSASANTNGGASARSGLYNDQRINQQDCQASRKAKVVRGTVAAVARCDIYSNDVSRYIQYTLCKLGANALKIRGWEIRKEKLNNYFNSACLIYCMFISQKWTIILFNFTSLIFLQKPFPTCNASKMQKYNIELLPPLNF